MRGGAELAPISTPAAEKQRAARCSLCQGERIELVLPASHAPFELRYPQESQEARHRLLVCIHEGERRAKQRSCHNVQVVHPFEADSSKKSLGLQLMCIGQFPIAPAAPPVHHRPRLRALALLGRRPHQRVEGHVIPASEKPTHPFEADSSKKSLGLQLMCIGQFPIAPAAPPVHHRPRLRALALLGRRPHQRVEGHVIPASEKPTQ